MLCVRCTVIVKQLVIRTGLGVNLVHVLLHNCRKSIIVWVAGLSCLEEDIRVLSGTSLAGIVGIQSMLAELGDGIPVSHLSQIIIIPCLNLLDLMGSAETVEEVNKRNFALDCSQMSHCSQVHNFLYAGLAQHSASGLAACIYIRVITKNRQCVAGQSTSGYVDNARKLLAGNLVQIRNHQKQTLGSRVGSRKSACSQ